ncbi:MAG: TetR/AcrR family transcriptional regulator [Alphaproteobacteria bacterium]|nr:TetR/AcrR family transcriptional regulator [Alphaproteobacteria bacterium]
MPKTPPPPPRGRDRDATERLILAAAKEVLGEEGFANFGVNAIARRAGCDKQLIYRYYGGLDGLADAIGADLAATLSEELKPLSTPTPETYGELMRRLALGLLELLRRDRLMQQITAWEAAAPSPLVKRLIAARAKRMAMWMFEMHGALQPPPDVDAPAMNAIVIAAIQQIVVSAAANGEFSGLALREDAQWERLRVALIKLLASVYGD